jgi:putative PEP-CTERM system TPR-repeat lipoprotein
MFVQARDNDKAAAQVEVLKKMAPGSPYTLHAIGIVAFAKGDTATALDATQKSLEIAPDYMPARYLSGLIDLKRGAYASAAQSFRTVVAKSPEDDGVRMALAETLLRQGRGAQAQEVLEPTLVRSPENETALRLAAEIQLAQKRPAEAADLLAKANALDGANVKGRVRLAEVRLAKGETSQGVRDLESLSASDPNAREPDIALVSAFLRARDYPKALAAAETIVKKQPSSPVGYNTVGAVYMVMGDFKAARQSLEKALSIDPGFLAAQYGLARLDTGERDFDGAKARYQKILDKLPNSEPALLGLAEILNATAAPSETTAAAIQRAVSANPSSVGARLALINYYASRKNFTVALTAAQAAQAAIPDNPAILDLLASVQQSAGETNQAIETYTRLSKLQPDNPGPLIRLARIQASQKNYEAAIAFLKSARIAAPDNPTVWSALAGTYYDATRADEGLAEARRLQKEMPAQAAGYVLEADILALQKKMPEAAAAYRAALVRQAPPLVVVRLYALLNAQNKGDEAAAVAQKWLADHPSDATVRAYLGQRKLESKDYKVAARYFREAVDIDPSNASMLNNLAWSLMETNDPKALDYAERAYRIAPGDAAVVNTYGSILVQRGDLAQGIRHLRRSVALDPADSALRLSLARALIKNGDKDGARKELEVVAKTKSAADKSEAEQLLKGI